MIAIEADAFRISEYDSRFVVFTWSVPIPLPIVWTSTFLAQDNGVSVEQKPDLRQEVGIYGESVPIPQTDKSGNLRVRLLPGSPTQTLFEMARTASEASVRNGGPVNKGSLGIADLNGNSRAIKAIEAYIEGPPTMIAFGRVASLVEYNLLCDGVSSFWEALRPLAVTGAVVQAFQ